PEFAVANVHLSHGQILNRRQLHRIARFLPGHAMIIGDCNMLGPSLLPRYSDIGPRMATHNAGHIIPLRLDRCFVRGLTILEAALLNRGTSDHRPMAVICLAD
ncbi:MAG TPA: endonuclease/exonuclease/phosphatase family protein, partial [Stellaceae bacterium]|nr:endonuclease/exonuclease/phosphatase family protein [Stellaceae bacterium]